MLDWIKSKLGYGRREEVKFDPKATRETKIQPALTPEELGEEDSSIFVREYEQSKNHLEGQNTIFEQSQHEEESSQLDLTQDVDPPQLDDIVLEDQRQSDTASQGSSKINNVDVDSEGDVLTQIGDFEILKLLGKGGFGSVYLAQDKEMYGKFRALKLVNLGKGEQVKQRLKDAEREGKALTELEHPNIVNIYRRGFAEINGEQHIFLAQQYIDGGDLKELNGSQRVNPHRAVDIAKTIAGALAHAHSKGIIHRDIKPANILVDDQEKLYLTDFGLAFEEESRYDKDEQGAIKGTMAYMAPEQVRGEADKIDQRTDIYELGAMLYHFVSGQTQLHRVWDQATLTEDDKEDLDTKEQKQLFVSRVVTPIANYAPHCSPILDWEVVDEDLAAIVDKMMAKEMDHRYNSMGEVIEDLERWEAGMTVSARTDYGIWERWQRDHHKKLIGVGVTLLALIVGGFMTRSYISTQAELEKVLKEEKANEIEAGKIRPEVKRKIDLAMALREALGPMTGSEKVRDSYNANEDAITSVTSLLHLVKKDKEVSSWKIELDEQKKEFEKENGLRDRAKQIDQWRHLEKQYDPLEEVTESTDDKFKSYISTLAALHIKTEQLPNDPIGLRQKIRESLKQARETQISKALGAFSNIQQPYQEFAHAYEQTVAKNVPKVKANTNIKDLHSALEVSLGTISTTLIKKSKAVKSREEEVESTRENLEEALKTAKQLRSLQDSYEKQENVKQALTFLHESTVKTEEKTNLKHLLVATYLTKAREALHNKQYGTATEYTESARKLIHYNGLEKLAGSVKKLNDQTQRARLKLAERALGHYKKTVENLWRRHFNTYIKESTAKKRIDTALADLEKVLRDPQDPYLKHAPLPELTSYLTEAKDYIEPAKKESSGILKTDEKTKKAYRRMVNETVLETELKAAEKEFDNRPATQDSVDKYHTARETILNNHFGKEKKD